MEENDMVEVKPVKLGRGLACKWGPDIIEQIRQMADEGLSADQASVKLDGLMSRNAVIGIAFRKGIKFNGYVAGTDRRRKLRAPNSEPSKPKPKKAKIEPTKPAPRFHCYAPAKPRGMVTMMELREDSCRYPYETRDGLRYCGDMAYTDPVRDKRYSWCGAHCLTVYQRDSRA